MLTLAAKIDSSQRLKDVVSEACAAAGRKGNPSFVFAKALRRRAEKNVDDVSEKESEDRVRQAPGEVDDQLKPAHAGVQFVALEYARLQAVQNTKQESDRNRGSHLHCLHGDRADDYGNEDAEKNGYEYRDKTLQHVRHDASRLGGLFVG